jgi:hypothetical protein
MVEVGRSFRNKVLLDGIPPHSSSIQTHGMRRVTWEREKYLHPTFSDAGNVRYKRIALGQAMYRNTLFTPRRHVSMTSPVHVE